MKHLTPEQKAQIIELRRKGKTFREIASTVGAPLATVAKHYYTHGQRPS